MERLTAGDLANFWAEGATTPMQIAVAAVLADADATFDLAAARALIARRLHRVPLLRKRVRWTRLGEGPPAWVPDEPPDVAQHVDVAELPGPVREEAFLAWCAAESIRPLERERALWRIRFVRGVEGRDVGMLVVLHHAVADGLRGVALFGALLDSDASDGESAEAAPAEKAPGFGALLADNLLRQGRGLLRATRALPGLPRRLARAWKQMRDALKEMEGLVTPTPLTREVGSSRQLFVVRRPIDPLLQRARGLGVKLNDLLLAAVTAGLREWLLEGGADVGRMLLRASVPIGAAEKNEGGVMLVPLPVGEADPSERLRAIAEFTRTAKLRRKTSDSVGWLAPALPVPLSWLVVKWMRRFGRSRVTAYVTNVPGPSDPFSFGGARLRSIAPIGPLVAGVALSVAILSYAGTVSVSVHVDGEVADIRSLADELARELDRFVDAERHRPAEPFMLGSSSPP